MQLYIINVCLKYLKAARNANSSTFTHEETEYHDDRELKLKRFSLRSDKRCDACVSFSAVKRHTNLPCTVCKSNDWENNILNSICNTCIKCLEYKNSTPCENCYANSLKNYHLSNVCTSCKKFDFEDQEILLINYKEEPEYPIVHLNCFYTEFTSVISELKKSIDKKSYLFNVFNSFNSLEVFIENIDILLRIKHEAYQENMDFLLNYEILYKREKIEEEMNVLIDMLNQMKQLKNILHHKLIDIRIFENDIILYEFQDEMHFKIDNEPFFYPIIKRLYGNDIKFSHLKEISQVNSIKITCIEHIYQKNISLFISLFHIKNIFLCLKNPIYPYKNPSVKSFKNEINILHLSVDENNMGNTGLYINNLDIKVEILEIFFREFIINHKRVNIIYREMIDKKNPKYLRIENASSTLLWNILGFLDSKSLLISNLQIFYIQKNSSTKNRLESFLKTLENRPLHMFKCCRIEFEFLNSINCYDLYIIIFLIKNFNNIDKLSVSIGKDHINDPNIHENHISTDSWPKNDFCTISKLVLNFNYNDKTSYIQRCYIDLLIQLIVFSRKLELYGNYIPIFQTHKEFYKIKHISIFSQFIYYIELLNFIMCCENVKKIEFIGGNLILEKSSYITDDIAEKIFIMKKNLVLQLIIVMNINFKHLIHILEMFRVLDFVIKSLIFDIDSEFQTVTPHFDTKKISNIIIHKKNFNENNFRILTSFLEKHKIWENIKIIES